MHDRDGSSGTLLLRISGRVQGVNYREAMRMEAERLGVTGWVRNRRDGTVEAVVQGASACLDAIVAWARVGPPAARVTSVETRAAEGDLDQPYSDFRRLPSL
jgi:acylphosphatase